ncbi:MAG: DUF222 domain-containing protein [Acidimicrobiia bacterium]
MFDSRLTEIELTSQQVASGESEDRIAYLTTVDELSSGWASDDRETLPDLESMVPGAFLAVVLEYVDRAKLKGFDLVNVLRARERMVSHLQAASIGDSVEVSHAAPGHSESEPDRLGEAFAYAADEIRAALTLTRRAAEYRLSFASDLLERLPQVHLMLSEGRIELTKARAFSDGTAHVPDQLARTVVARLAGAAPNLTAGQLRRRIRRLCVSEDPESAAKREKTAREERKLVIEPTVDGTADLHLHGLRLDDARAIGRRVNGHMLSLKREDRSGRTHDQLRADIVRDLLLGDDPTVGGRGLVDIHIPLSTLDGGSDPAEIGGLGTVTAETARQIVCGQPNADHQITLVDANGSPTHIYTLSRRETKKIRSHMEALQPTCSFPGCIAPATDCDYDHIQPWVRGGETSTINGGPKCDHDHELKDHGWTHRRADRQDIWVSPLGHTYVTQGQSP